MEKITLPINNSLELEKQTSSRSGKADNRLKDKVTKILTKIDPKQMDEFTKSPVQLLNLNGGGHDGKYEVAESSLKGRTFEKTYCRRKYLKPNEGKVGSFMSGAEDSDPLKQKLSMQGEAEFVDMEDDIYEDVSAEEDESFESGSQFSVWSDESILAEEVLLDIKGMFASSPGHSDLNRYNQQENATPSVGGTFLSSILYT